MQLALGLAPASAKEVTCAPPVEGLTILRFTSSILDVRMGPGDGQAVRFHPEDTP